MKIALVGYGKMGHIIEQVALKRGHTIVSKIDIGDSDRFDSDDFRSADVAIEFTTPATAFDNYQRCFAAGLPVVTGTTGWTERLDDIKSQCETEGRTFFYASNFSIGVNVFIAVNKYLARLMNNFPAFDPSLFEEHHIHKLDAPSGTCITLANDIVSEIDRKKQWRLHDKKIAPYPKKPTEDLMIRAKREGDTVGFHEVCYESADDFLIFSHTANDRSGFALGAVLAAEFTADHKGFLTMQDLLKLPQP